MRINHNISALNTYRQLTANNNATSKSLSRLSSGLRINSAADDAAGLAISEKMRGQIRGLDQATSNANNGISLIHTAEGALNETHSILQRMRELAVQSANDTNTDADRKEIQKEIDQLSTEITRISTDTEFNTQKLLDGSMASTATATPGAAGSTASIAAGSSLKSDTYTISITSYTAAAPATAGTPEVAATATSSNAAVTIAGTYTGTDDITLTYVAAGGTTPHGETNGGTAGWYTADEDGTTPNATNGVAYQGITISGTAAAANTISLTAAVPAVPAAAAVKEKFEATVTNAAGESISASNFNITAKAVENFTVVVNSNSAMTFHIGANKDQNTKLNIQSMSASSLGVSSLDLTTQAGANSAIETIDAAISTVSAQRAGLGAMQNRLEHTINNLGTTSENLTASESQIRDVDMAKEMMEFTKNNILSQAAQSMLAQANQMPQNVLQLLQ